MGDRTMPGSYQGAIPAVRPDARVSGMSEEQMSGGGPESDPAMICSWCSAVLKSATEERCPSCGAALHEADGSEVPGLTRVDHEAILRSRTPAQRSRGLIGWLSGEYRAEAAPEPPGTFAPPPDDVRREMLRLELAALEAEVLARRAEAAALAADTSSGETDTSDHTTDATDARPETVGAEDEALPDARPAEEPGRG